MMDVDSLLKKLRYKEIYISQIINLPNELGEILNKVKTSFTHDEPCDFRLLFVKDHRELLFYFLDSMDCAKNDSVFWLAYPKKSGKLASDLDRDSIWKSIEQYGYRPVSMVSIDSTWSAMRVRPTSEL